MRKRKLTALEEFDAFASGMNVVSSSDEEVQFEQAGADQQLIVPKEGQTDSSSNC